MMLIAVGVSDGAARCAGSLRGTAVEPHEKLTVVQLPTKSPVPCVTRSIAAVLTGARDRLSPQQSTPVQAYFSQIHFSITVPSASQPCE